MQRRPAVLASALSALFLLAASAPAMAHHSAAMFDRAKQVTVTGTVKDYLYTNPHCWITVTVGDPEGGAPVDWAIEGYTPGAMRGFGLSPSTVKPGDKVTVVLHPLKDGRKGGSLIEYTFPDGKTVHP